MESEKKKLFVGGLLGKTTDNSMREHFIKYGAVESCSVCWDANKGISKGFGFVSFSESSSAKDALQEKTHVIDGRKVDVKQANFEGERHTRHHMGLNNNSNDGSSNDLFRNKKIFVGGLASNVTDEELRKYFEEFGTITDAVVIHDRATNLSRGFGFITFELEECAEKVMQSRFYHLGGKSVEVKRAVPRDENNNSSFNDKFWEGRWSPLNGYQHGSYPDYGYGFDVAPHLAPLPLPWYYGCEEYFNNNAADGYRGWPVGAYGGMVYRVPYILPCFPGNGSWNDSWRNGARGFTLPNGRSYPSSVNCRVGVVGKDGVHGEITGVELNANGKVDGVVGSAAASDKQEDQRDIEGQCNGIFKLTIE